MEKKTQTPITYYLGFSIFVGFWEGFRVVFLGLSIEMKALGLEVRIYSFVFVIWGLGGRTGGDEFQS